ncbi:MAG: hypothetical protein K8R77_00585 [Anaerolineaceae bacterium]|nr:hypothetical protein [Anaerolineaceae bacterium]
MDKQIMPEHCQTITALLDFIINHLLSHLMKIILPTGYYITFRLAYAGLSSPPGLPGFIA